MNIKFFTLLFLCLITVIRGIHAQDCGVEIGSIYGSPETSEEGKSLAATADGTGFYVAGAKDDRSFIMKVKLNGQVEWSRTFDVIPGEVQDLNSFVLDSDGMLALVGTTGGTIPGKSVYVFRYDPENNQVLWANEIVTAARNEAHSIIQLDNGNYLISNNPAATNNNNAELIEVSLTDGAVVSGFAKNYDMGGTSSEQLSDIIQHGNFIYGAGRYTDGGSPAEMRHTLVKVDATTGNHVWAKLGHVPGNQSARLYGTDLVIDDDAIYSLYTGDPAGISVTNRKAFIQKTDLDGNLIWLKQYELSGPTDEVHELIKSGNGFVVLASKAAFPSEVILFKIDSDGNVLWGQLLQPGSFVTSTIIERSTAQLIEVGSNLIFTATATTQNDTKDIIVIRADLEGNVSDQCMINIPMTIEASEISNADFYSVTPMVGTVEPNLNSKSFESQNQDVQPRQECILDDTTVTVTVEATICMGEVFQGYSQAGIYIDSFVTVNGCDSIRILHLAVNSCEEGCGESIAHVYGSPDADEQGIAIAYSQADNAIYVVGSKEDSTFLLKMRPSGATIWYKTFDFAPAQDESPTGIIVDSDGALAVLGTTGEYFTGGNLYMMKYDPNLQTILWTKEYDHSPRDFSFGLTQNVGNGNYIITSQAQFPGHHEPDVIEIDRNTGSVNPGFAKNYSLSGTESLYDITHDGSFLYGVGRYKDGSTDDFRHTIVKIDPDNGDQLWTRLGHVTQNGVARLYGTDIIFDQGSIYSTYFGDPDGTSITNTFLYIQKTDLDGNVIWVKQYDLPGPNDISLDIIRSGDGFVVLAFNRLPGEYMLMKVDPSGNVLWSNLYSFNGLFNPTSEERGSSQLIEAGDQLIFTGSGTDPSGNSDMIIARTDLEGNGNSPCMETQTITIPTIDITNPIFYLASPEQTTVQVVEFESSVESNIALLMPREGCLMLDSVTELNINICHDESFEGYTISGTYIDTFDIGQECDSIRILHLKVFACAPIIHYDLNACTSYMIDGSHMDYSEFTPEYPEGSCAELNADHLYQVPSPDNKHSCTPGVNNTEAMCVGAYQSCTYTPGHSAAVLIDFTVNPVEDSIFRFSGLEFYEKAPANYSWISGPSGPNNYPLRYGIRILKNGVEIFRGENNPTNLSWTLQSFDFMDNDLFLVDEAASFRIELLPYCPVGNGADVSAWDLDEITIYAACAPIEERKPLVTGKILTANYQALSNVQVKLSKNASFSPEISFLTDESGTFEIDDFESESNYYIKCYNDEYPLNGVSALDLIYIQKHLLGTIPFSTLDRYVAADADNNGKVNVLDALELRKLLLGINDGFSNNTSWRFGVMPQNMTGSDIVSFQEIRNIEIKDDTIQSDFMGIKIGDLNGDVKLYLQGTEVESRSVNTFGLGIADREVKAGQIVTLDLIALDDYSLSGLQFAIDLSNFDLVSILEGVLQVSSENIFISDDGILRFVWTTASATELSDNEVLFRLVLTPNTTGLLSSLIAVKEEILKPEAYTGSNLEVRELELSYLINELESPDAVVIEPNPFHSELYVKFKLDKETNMQFNFYDLSGRLLFQTEGIYNAGINREVIYSDQLPVYEGIIYCQIISDGTVTTRKVMKY